MQIQRIPDARKNNWIEGSTINLLLKEILERLAGVARARNVLGGNSGTGLRGRRRRIFFDGRAKFVKSAVVLLILAWNALGNRLHAFKARGCIEVRALFARVKLEPAFRALAFWIEALLQNSAAI